MNDFHFLRFELELPVAVLAIAGAIVRWIQLRAEESQKQCVDILRTIDGCNQIWAVETKAGLDATPTWDDLRGYVKSAAPPPLALCPSGGTYTIGRVRDLPSCSIARHQRAFEAIPIATNPAGGNAGLLSEAVGTTCFAKSAIVVRRPSI